MIQLPPSPCPAPPPAALSTLVLLSSLLTLSLLHLNISIIYIYYYYYYFYCSYMIIFSLHWLFFYLFISALRNIYSLPINLSVVRIKIIQVITLMHTWYVHSGMHAKSCTQHCLLLCLWMLCLCCRICRLWLWYVLKVEHWNIMDALKKSFLFFLTSYILGMVLVLLK